MGVAVALRVGDGGNGNKRKSTYHLLRPYYVPNIVPLTLYLICSTQQPYKKGIIFLILDVKKLRLKRG